MKSISQDSIAFLFFIFLVFVLSGLISLPVYAISAGQIDTFENGTTMNWGGGASPVNAGGFLQISRPENAPFHLATRNSAQWTGDYLAAGVHSIGMDLNYLGGPNSIRVRLMLWGDGGVWASRFTQFVSAGGWNPHVFGLSAADLQLVRADQNLGETGILSDTLSNVTRLQIRHDYNTPTPPGSHPEHIAATLGLDNIQAIPEPATWMLLVLASAMLIRKKKQAFT